jgi:Fe-S-cluster containining protein
MGDDDIPPELTVEDQWGGSMMLRLADGWCAALDRNTLRCTIYERRPGICRDYRMGGSDCIGERARLVALHAATEETS